MNQTAIQHYGYQNHVHLQISGWKPLIQQLCIKEFNNIQKHQKLLKH